MRLPLRILLLLLSGGLLGFAYPPFETGMLAAAGLVPLFIVLVGLESAGAVFRHSYAAFLVMNLITLYWPGGFAHGKDGYLMISGALLIVAHPLFFSLPMLVWHTVRRSMGLRVSLLLFPIIWVGFEFAHSSTQLSFPWLALGNTQTYDPGVLAVVAYTGVYGLSFWLAALNVILFFLFAYTSARPPGGRAKVALALGACAIALALAARLVPAWTPRAEHGEPLRIAVIQPDIDPFEKWGPDSGPQLETLRNLTDSALAGGKPDMILWPETAVPFYLLADRYRADYLSLAAYVDGKGVPLLTGAPDIVFHRDGAPAGAKRLPDGTRYETFNSAVLMAPGSDTVQKFAKTLLVPFAERVPFSDVLSFLNAAQWNFGLGGWSMGRDTALLRLPLSRGDTVAFGNLVCYESIFPGYVADLVRRGARFLTVVTNDSWWGRTAGPYQHRQFAVLRAVENARWIVQCANGGISFVVDPRGVIVDQTELFTRTVLHAGIGTPSGLTPYSRHGDVFAEACLALTLILFAAAGLNVVMKRKMGTP